MRRILTEILILIAAKGSAHGYILNCNYRWRRRTTTAFMKADNLGPYPSESTKKLVDFNVHETVTSSNKTIGMNHHSSKNNAPSNSLHGLSKRHQNIVASTNERQICVTGQYPLYISTQYNPTRKWIFSSMNSILPSNLPSSSSSRRIPSTLQMLVNGTTIDRSLASYDRFQWLEEQERIRLHENHSLLSIELLAEIDVPKPGYLHIFPSTAKQEPSPFFGRSATKGKRGNNLDTFTEGRERLWITGFSMTQSSGEIHYIDIYNAHLGKLHARTRNSIRWPNEVTLVPRTDTDTLGYEDALLIADGFLVPGKDQGGIYVVLRPGHPTNEWKVCLTGGLGMDGLLSKLEDQDNIGNWFYHKASWVDLTGDGRLSVLTARCSRVQRTQDTGTPSFSSFRSQLVFLERPKPFKYDKDTGTPLDADGLVFDPFSPRHTPWKTHVLDDGPDVMFSIADLDTTDDSIEVIASQFFSQRVTLHSIQKGLQPKVVFRRTIDDNCGSAYCTVLADLDLIDHPSRIVIDGGSSIPTYKHGDSFSHVLVTNHESVEGGSLFCYRIPDGTNEWKTKGWEKSIIASGISVSDQILNIWNPGAPGFCYTFYAKRKEAEDKTRRVSRPLIGIAGDCANKAIILRPSVNMDLKVRDPSTQYSVMCEIECSGTVGSLAVGYDDLLDIQLNNRRSDYAKVYIPSYDTNKILVFALGLGEEDWF